MTKKKNLSRTVSIILFSVFCVTASVCQTSFYIDPSFAGAGRNGSPSTPWQSLNDSGSWSAINSALASGNVTVFFSATGSSTSALGIGSRTDTSSHILTLDGISKQNTNSSSPSWTTNVIPSPCKFDAPGCAWASARKFTITATTPVAGSDSATNCKNYFTIQGFTLHNTEGQSADLTYTGNLTFQYNDVSRVATGSYGPGVIVGPGNQGPCNNGGNLSGPDNVTVQNNHIHATWGECIYVGASTPDPPGGTTACGTACHTGDNYLIQDNLIESCASWGGQGDGTDVKDGHTNLRVIGNTYRTSKPCTNCGTQTPGNDGQGPLFESGSLVDSNYIEAPGHQCIPVYTSWNNSVGRGDMTVRNNMCVNINSGVGSNTGIHLWSPSVPTIWSSIHIYNNTIFNTDDVCLQVDSGNTANGATIENNICNSTSGGIIAGSGTISSHDYNDFYNVTGTVLSYGGTFTCGDLTSSETHSMCVDPMFVSTATPYVDKNFMLQSASPIATSGASLSALFKTDYFGTTRNAPWDMGATAETTSSGPNPPTSLTATVN
jgi:hypothetical protein